MTQHRTQFDALSRWEAIDLFGQASDLVEHKRYGSLALLLGMTDDIGDDLTLLELMDVITVRLTDLARRCGFNDFGGAA